MAELANFPKSVVEHAKRKAAELEDFSEGGDAEAEKPKKRHVEAAITAFMSKAKDIPQDATPQKRLEELRAIRASLSDVITKAGLVF